MAVGSILFLKSWYLVGLLVLPLLLWLLKVIPPTPIRIQFPAIGLLMGLDSQGRSSASAPWWLIVIRLLMAMLLILAVAKPILDPDAALPGEGPVILVIDDGWQAAPSWHEKIKALEAFLDIAARSERPVIMQATARDYDGG